jgi:hypothetical protein
VDVLFRNIMVLLHIFGAVMLIGPVLLALPLVLRYLKRQPLATSQLGPLLVPLGSLPKFGGIVQLLTGLALVAGSGWATLSYTWIWGSLVLLVAASVIGATRIEPALHKLAALATADQVTEAAVTPPLAQATLFVTVNAVLAAVILVLMVVRI